MITWISRSASATPACSTGDAFEAAAHDVQCILGGEEQDATGARHREPAQARHTRCDRHREVQSQERLAALGLAPDDANRLLGPQVR